MEKVLFVCIHNSGRSQMAEAFLNKLGAGRFEAESAGFEPGALNPIVVAAMKESGIDISKAKTKSVFDLQKQGRSYQHVVTVCDETSAERCPLFPGGSKRMHWGFRDPAGKDLSVVREVRDEIKKKIEDFVREAGKGL